MHEGQHGASSSSHNPYQLHLQTGERTGCLISDRCLESLQRFNIGACGSGSRHGHVRRVSTVSHVHHSHAVAYMDTSRRA